MDKLTPLILFVIGVLVDVSLYGPVTSAIWSDLIHPILRDAQPGRDVVTIGAFVTLDLAMWLILVVLPGLALVFGMHRWLTKQFTELK